MVLNCEKLCIFNYQSPAMIRHFVWLLLRMNILNSTHFFFFLQSIEISLQVLARTRSSASFPGAMLCCVHFKWLFNDHGNFAHEYKTWCNTFSDHWKLQTIYYCTKIYRFFSTSESRRGRRAVAWCVCVCVWGVWI